MSTAGQGFVLLPPLRQCTVQLRGFAFALLQGIVLRPRIVGILFLWLVQLCLRLLLLTWELDVRPQIGTVRVLSQAQGLHLSRSFFPHHLHDIVIRHRIVGIDTDGTIQLGAVRRLTAFQGFVPLHPLRQRSVQVRGFAFPHLLQGIDTDDAIQLSSVPVRLGNFLDFCAIVIPPVGDFVRLIHILILFLQSLEGEDFAITRIFPFLHLLFGQACCNGHLVLQGFLQGILPLLHFLWSCPSYLQHELESECKGERRVAENQTTDHGHRDSRSSFFARVRGEREDEDPHRQCEKEHDNCVDLGSKGPLLPRRDQLGDQFHGRHFHDLLADHAEAEEGNDLKVEWCRDAKVRAALARGEAHFLVEEQLREAPHD